MTIKQGPNSESHVAMESDTMLEKSFHPPPMEVSRYELERSLSIRLPGGFVGQVSGWSRIAFTISSYS